MTDHTCTKPSDGTTCPICGEKDAWHLDHDITYGCGLYGLIFSMRCRKCGANWKSYYNLEFDEIDDIVRKESDT